ncbi:hypothetical protein C8Q76DRAFT_790931 [Earliella scabrosa]|nr:hypothetical protein C8Q76DRAFT_790931 [Earliella scabrosa]
MTAAPAFSSPRCLIESAPITLPELYEWNAQENPDYPLFRFHDGIALHDITYSRALTAIRQAAQYVQSFAGIEERVPIAILANTGTSPPSPFLSCLSDGLPGSEQFHHVLRHCRHILVSEDEHMLGLAADAIQQVDGAVMHPIRSFEDLVAADDSAEAANDCYSPVKHNVDDIAMILHSSGSTNHPKPIYWTHKRMVSRGTTSWYGEVDLTGCTIAGHGTPVFHAHGVSLYSTAVTTGIIIGVFPPSRPLVLPSSENVFAGAIATRADYIVTVPPFVEEWARDPEKVTHMKRTKGVWFGGGELRQEVGDMLASQGISLIIVYGCTEVGAVANVIPAKPGMDYAYFTITPWIETIQMDAGDGKYEIFVLSRPECPLAVTNTTIDGVEAYATNDLVVPHPKRPGYWKLIGRRDDQIVLANGEKMILVTSPSKPFDYNGKGNIRRNPILQRYSQEIDALYVDVERSVQPDIASPSDWNASSTQVFIRAVVHKVLVRPVSDEADLFRSGCDSLQATWIRNTILRPLRETSPSTADLLPMDIVFKAPSIRALGDAILHGFTVPTTTVADLTTLVDKYSSNLPARPATLRHREHSKDVVLITGTTGGFGCDLLEHLLRDDNVMTVYAFNRQGPQVMAKQRERFRARGLDVELLDSGKFVMVEAELDVPGFAIPPERLDEIQSSVTLIMHNAWKVDYNLSLPSFVAELEAARRLIELSLSSPYIDLPAIQFVSSIGVLRNCTLQPPVHEVHRKGYSCP